MFQGVSVALVTPFQNNVVDESALRKLVGHLLDQGVHGLFPTGCTGEAATLSTEEKERVWRVVLEEARGRAFVVAGTGTNDTASTIELTRRAAGMGVDGCMLIAPYYNKPSPAGLEHHYLSVADAVDVPLVIYNVPGRTGVNIRPETVARIARHPRVRAIKEASGSVDQVTEVLCSTDLTVLSGDDSLTLPMAAAGAHGVVSVLGHVAARDTVAMLEHHAKGRVGEAAAIHRRLYPVVQALFAESNPGPVKAALCRLGLIANELRAPMVPVGAATAARVEEALEVAGLMPATA